MGVLAINLFLSSIAVKPPTSGGGFTATEDRSVGSDLALITFGLHNLAHLIIIPHYQPLLAERFGRCIGYHGSSLHSQKFINNRQDEKKGK